jgi:DNA-binding CsgD family transcriptional regulator
MQWVAAHPTWAGLTLTSDFLGRRSSCSRCLSGCCWVAPVPAAGLGPRNCWGLRYDSSGHDPWRGAAGRALAYFSAAKPSARAARPFPELTDRELDVLRLLAEGANNSTVASSLHLSDKTVRNYVASILTKLQAEDRAQATVRALHAGLGRPDDQTAS